MIYRTLKTAGQIAIGWILQIQLLALAWHDVPKLARAAAGYAEIVLATLISTH